MHRTHKPSALHLQPLLVVVRLIARWIIAGTTLSALPAYSNFVTYTGGTAVEQSWRTAVGVYALETFESQLPGTQINSLPALGVGFSALRGGGFPVIYSHFETNSPYGNQHLANFPNGINGTNKFDDIQMNVLAGFKVTAAAFWNGDGQADTLVATVFDILGAQIGTVGAFKGTFAGFISDRPVGKVVFGGRTGDGWNHLDGLQTHIEPLVIPTPTSFALVSIALIALVAARLHKPANVVRSL